MWTYHHHEAEYFLGYIPQFINPNLDIPAKEQLHHNYAHGGGWMKLDGWKLLPGDRIIYSGDPPYSPVATLKLKNERVVVYPDAWVAIINNDGSFEVARMD